jgi:hypothetical protein
MSAVAIKESLTLPANAALEQFRRVKRHSSGDAVYAGDDERGLGVVNDPVVAAGDLASILGYHEAAAIYMVAAAAFGAGSKVYAAADGKISNAGVVPLGTALEASAGNGAVLRVCPAVNDPGVTSTVVPKTADYTVTAGDSGKTFTTVGAAGTVTFALPAATLGLKYRFRVGAAQQLRVDPNSSETVALPSTGVQGAAGKYLVADADGETVDLECTKAGQWSVFGFTGSWTAEA